MVGRIRHSSLLTVRMLTVPKVLVQPVLLGTAESVWTDAHKACTNETLMHKQCQNNMTDS